jgi:hypothetical protein
MWITKKNTETLWKIACEKPYDKYYKQTIEVIGNR